MVKGGSERRTSIVGRVCGSFCTVVVQEKLSREKKSGLGLAPRSTFFGIPLSAPRSTPCPVLPRPTPIRIHVVTSHSI